MLIQGIDIRYYFDSGRDQVRLPCKTRANISAISFRLPGADAFGSKRKWRTDLLKQASGEVKHGKLYAYQQYGTRKGK